MTTAAATSDPPPDVVGAPLEAESFPQQWGFVKATSIRNVVKCSRQSGKTSAIRLRTRDQLVRGRKSLYIARVRRNVREQYYLPLKDEIARVGLVPERNEADFILRLPNGGMSMGMSADDISDIEKGRGYQWDDVVVDETQSFKDEVLEPLIDLILIPTLFKSGGSLSLGGTPPDPDKGDAMNGYFVRVIRKALQDRGLDDGWKLYEWTIFDNPHIPAANVHQAYKARGIGPGHPIWEAEVMGRLVDNPANRVFPFGTNNEYSDAEWTDAVAAARQEPRRK